MEKVYRNESFDILKGFAILMVVVGHLVAGENRWNISNWVNSFHLPLFMFVGGSLAYSFTNNQTKHTRDLFKILVVKRFFSLIVPYLLWSTILYQVIRARFEIDILDNLRIYLIYPPSTVLWFLHTYYFMNVAYFIYLLVFRYVKSSFLLDIFVVAMLFTIAYFAQEYTSVIPKGIFVFFPYYFLGVLIRKYAYWTEKIIAKDYMIALLSSGFFVASLLYGRYENTLLNVLLKLISGGFGALCFSYLVNKIQLNQYIKSTLISFGKNSIVIYILHFTMLFSISSMLNENGYEIHQFWLLLLGLFFATIIAYSCVFIGDLIDKVAILNGLLFGRWKK